MLPVAPGGSSRPQVNLSIAHSSTLHNIKKFLTKTKKSGTFVPLFQRFAQYYSIGLMFSFHESSSTIDAISFASSMASLISSSVFSPS